MTDDQFQALQAHLFPGDNDEHGAIIAAGVAESNGHVRLLAREVFLAQDGRDYVAGKYGYRMLKAEFIQPRIRHCKTERLAYIAVHNHGGTNFVEFSQDDYDSHERGYPALLDIANGMPVGAAVFAHNACAGDIWFPGGFRLPIAETKIVGTRIRRLFSKPPIAKQGRQREIYDRQLLMFGELGQARLRKAKVAVVGLGGVGSLVTEYLARLGVGHLLLVDDDRITLSNLSRVVGASRWDARWPFSAAIMPKVIREFAVRHSVTKNDIAKRLILAANSNCKVTTFLNNFAENAIAREFVDCDFIFLAADSMQARLVANAISQQYLIPGMQIGSKILPSVDGEKVEQAYSVVRWMLPGCGCLWCNELIDRQKLAEEAKTITERIDQAYGTQVHNPSVITLNAVGAAHAVNDFMFSYLGLLSDSVGHRQMRFKHLSRSIATEQVDQDVDCPECGTHSSSRFARGDGVSLPTLKRSG